MKISSEIRKILEKRISHEKKVILLNNLLEKNPESIRISRFIEAERLLMQKKGIAAARVYRSMTFGSDSPRWLVERQARTLAKYAYHDISSNPIQESHNIYTEQLNISPEKAWKKIADILRKSKGYGFAAQCYANAGLAKTAAKMFEKDLKDPMRAAFYYEQAGEWLPAARMFKKSKEYDKAGACYDNAGMEKMAVRMWKKAGTLEKHDIGVQTLHNILGK